MGVMAIRQAVTLAGCQYNKAGPQYVISPLHVNGAAGRPLTFMLLLRANTGYWGWALPLASSLSSPSSILPTIVMLLVIRWVAGVFLTAQFCRPSVTPCQLPLAALRLAVGLGFGAVVILSRCLAIVAGWHCSAK